MGEGIAHRLRRPGPGDGIGRTPHRPGDLAARSARFADNALRPLPHAEPTSAGPVPGGTLAACTRTDVPVHRLAPVQAAGSMVVPRDLVGLQAPIPQAPTPQAPAPQASTPQARP
jgi:hypothetical protein